MPIISPSPPSIAAIFSSLGPLDPAAVATVQSFLRYGDLASGFVCLQWPDCGRERLLAFTCKSRHFCRACHQRRTCTIGNWIATSVCHEVPHRQFVFTIPKVLRGIFRKRRHLLTHLLQTATTTLREPPIHTASIKVQLGKHLWSNWATAAPWFSNTPDAARRTPKQPLPKYFLSKRFGKLTQEQRKMP